MGAGCFWPWAVRGKEESAVGCGSGKTGCLPYFPETQFGPVLPPRGRNAEESKRTRLGGVAAAAARRLLPAWPGSTQPVLMAPRHRDVRAGVGLLAEWRFASLRSAMPTGGRPWS